MDEIKCRICGDGQFHSWYKISEMRFGMNESFPYYKCGSCGCLQIKEYPANISDYYPSDYYAFESNPKLQGSGLVKKFILSHIANQCTSSKRTILGQLFYKVLGAGSVEKINGTKAGFQDKILEIGSGTGNNLIRLYKYGFRNLWGIDPFIEKDIRFSDQVKVFKKSVFELEEKEFDLIFLNHALEHMPDQFKVLKAIGNLLNKGGLLLITVPIVDTYHWRRYGINYVGMQAPRHFYIHSVKSMRILAEKNGFELKHHEFRSTAFQFWASEQYSLGIPLQHEKSFYRSGNRALFSKKTIAYFKKHAKELDQNRDGGSAMFYLKKVDQADV